MKLIVLIFASLLTLSACATVSEDQQFALQNRHTVAKENFHRAEYSCQKMGGVMEVNQRGIGAYNFRDYENARCVRR
jgi:uncharacterized protein YceK